MTGEPETKASLSQAATDAFFGVGRGIASTVYGTIVAMATLAAAYATEKDPWRLAVIVSSASTVLWIAHLYAHALSETIEHGMQPTRRSLAGIARTEIGIVLAAAVPVVALVLGAAGVLRESSAIWLAFGLGLATLAIQGYRFSRFEHFGLLRTLAATAVNVSLGLLVVLLKVAVGH